jgi:hypothetical protein
LRTPIRSTRRVAGPYHRLDRRERLVERPHTVLEVAADGTGPDRAAHGRRRIAVAGFEIGADGQVDGRGDARDRVDHELERDLLTVLVAVRGRDGVAGRRERGAARQAGDNTRTGHVPDVDEHERLGGVVQAPQLGGEIGSGHPASLGPCSSDLDTPRAS